MKKGIDQKKIEELLTRGVEKIYPSEEFLRDRLLSGNKLTIYLGVDPTGPTLHIGHMIPLLKLRQFQNLGHQVVLLIGDFTATIGDPTDKSATRTALSREQVIENARLYKEQAGRIISFDGENPAMVRYNSDWLAKLSLADTLDLMSKMTYAQTIKRDMFQKRIAEDKDLYLHEFMYPLMQGYDSVAMDVDGEVGGNDQTFNMLAGRDLMKKIKGKEKFVVSTKILADSAGAKMGKTTGNMVAFTDSPEEMFGKIMSWNDSMIIPGFELCTYLPIEGVDSIRADLSSGGVNPKEHKMALAKEIVGVYYGEDLAKGAMEEFVRVFQNKDLPEDMETYSAGADIELAELLVGNKILKSKSEFRRLLDEGAITFDGEKLEDPHTKVGRGGVIKIGKRRFAKIVAE